MAISLVSRANTQTQGFGPRSTPATSHTTGNLLVVVAQVQITGISITGVTDTAGNTYTQVSSSPFINAGVTNAQAIFYAKNITGNAANVCTMAFSSTTGAYCTIAVYEFSGCDASSPFVATGTGSALTGTAITTGSITISTPSVIVAVYETDAGATPTPGTGYSQTKEDSGGFVWDSYHITSSSEAASATGVGSNKWGIIASAFKSAAGGSTVKQLAALGVG